MQGVDHPEPRNQVLNHGRGRGEEGEGGGGGGGREFNSSHYTNKYTNTSLPFAGQYEQLTLIIYGVLPW